MGEADSSQEPVKQPIKDGKEKEQKLVSKAGIYLMVGLIVILILAKFPIPWDWVGMATSEEKSQVATEEVDGRITKTTTTIKTEPAKTLWDWMSLLLAPATLAGLGFAFQASQEQAKAAKEDVEKKAEAAAKKRADEQTQAEKDRGEDRLRDDALEAYVNSISDLLVGRSLSILAKQKARGALTNGEQDLLDAGMDVIRARTLSIFRRFTDYKDPKRTDGVRKGNILLFLYDTGLIGYKSEDELGLEDTADEQELADTEPEQFLQALLSLSGADLSGVNLSGAFLIGADLSGAFLSNANLRESNLSDASLRDASLWDADLILADLRGADLNGAFLNGASLEAAYLRDADLRDADLRGVDLRDADLIGANLDAANLDAADLSGTLLLAVDLSYTKSLTPQQLEGKNPPLLCKVRLPKNIEVDPNRDCKDLPGVLLTRDLKQFENMAEAQAYMAEVQAYASRPR